MRVSVSGVFSRVMSWRQTAALFILRFGKDQVTRVLPYRALNSM
jgi:hypothetical protein